MNTNTNYYEIIDGPSRERLFDSLRYAADKEANVASVVTVYDKESGENRTIPLKITSLTHEDGSGNSFLISGANMYHRRYKAYFNTKTRKGWIDFSE